MLFLVNTVKSQNIASTGIQKKVKTVKNYDAKVAQSKYRSASGKNNKTGKIYAYLTRMVKSIPKSEIKQKPKTNIKRVTN